MTLRPPPHDCGTGLSGGSWYLFHKHILLFMRKTTGASHKIHCTGELTKLFFMNDTRRHQCKAPLRLKHIPADFPNNRKMLCLFYSGYLLFCYIFQVIIPVGKEQQQCFVNLWLVIKFDIHGHLIIFPLSIYQGAITDIF